MKKLILTILLVTLLPVVAMAQQNEKKWYQVEVIVFKLLNANPAVTSSIVNAEDTVSQNEATHLKEYDPNDADLAYQALPDADYKLTKEQRRLKNSKNYRILLHKAWIQPAVRRGKFVQLVSGHDYSPTMTNDDAQVQGALQVNQYSSFFSVKANFTFKAPTEDAQSMQDQGYGQTEEKLFQSFHLDQARRMRLDTLNYFDNPAFGILVKIMPYNPQQSDSKLQQAS